MGGSIRTQSESHLGSRPRKVKRIRERKASFFPFKTSFRERTEADGRWLARVKTRGDTFGTQLIIWKREETQQNKTEVSSGLAHLDQLRRRARIKQREEDKQKARRLRTRALGNAPKWWTNTADQHHHATVNAYSSFEGFSLTLKPSVYLTSSVYLRTDRAAARAQIEWSRLKREASAFGSRVFLITLINMGIYTLKCIGFLLQQYFANENVCIEHVRMLY